MSAQTMTMYERQRAAERRRQRRRAELLNTLTEAAATIGIGASFIVCSVLLLCAM